MVKPTIKQDTGRVNRYKKNQKLFEGEHFDAFSMKNLTNPATKEYEKLRYVAINFAGMLSRLSADSLFGFEEFPSITFTDEKRQEWYEAFDFANNISTQLYESALENSFRGDALLRLRSEEGKLIFEDINPAIWHPIYAIGNVRKAITGHVFQWQDESSTYVGEDGKMRTITIQETHTKGKIETIAFLMGDKNETGLILSKEEVKALGYEPLVNTGIDDLLVFHVPNSRINTSIFGIDDYRDLMSLFYAINNRVSKIDNVLDKHGDPILAVPEGVLDEDGKVSKQAFGLIEMASGEGANVPQYIVWDAKLDSSFKMIESLVEFLFMTSETSPAAFGMDKNGQADSGRALKFKLLRTLAKKHRKQLYYDTALKNMIVVAQKFAKANKLTVNGLTVEGEPEMPQIEWQDGIINDEVEIMDIEERKIAAGLSSRVGVLQRMEGISKKQAEERVKEAQAEAQERTPSFNADPLGVNKDKKPTQ